MSLIHLTTPVALTPNGRGRLLLQASGVRAFVAFCALSGASTLTALLADAVRQFLAAASPLMFGEEWERLARY